MAPTDPYQIADSQLPSLADYLAEQDIRLGKLRKALTTWLEEAHLVLQGRDEYRDPLNYVAEHDRIQVVQGFADRLDQL
ncbi:hypothetical protein [uncultured Hymenobacter sp.]|uniref:hypothetical protein n=1 Tax=uncultured Hymenobacter sp. TaxID=170016 RepID=UPI0035CBD0EC